MANRRNSQDSTTTEAPAEAVTEQPTTEAPAAEAPKAEEKPVDLTAFQAAVASAVEEADKTTGDVPPASLEPVTKAYRELEGIKAKNAAKAFVNEQMKDRMNSDDLAGARAHLNISENALVAAAGSSTKAERPPADPTENFVQRVATLQLAYGLAVGSVPEGVKDDWQERVSTAVNEATQPARDYATWLTADAEQRGDEPEVSAVVRNAAKLAQGKSAKAGTARTGGRAAFDGPRGDIAEHVVNAFADKPEGTFLRIAEIRSTRSEGYGDNPPSAGAISARLFPKTGESSLIKLGIQPAEEGGKKGARKVTPTE